MSETLIEKIEAYRHKGDISDGQHSFNVGLDFAHKIIRDHLSSPELVERAAKAIHMAAFGLPYTSPNPNDVKYAKAAIASIMGDSAQGTSASGHPAVSLQARTGESPTISDPKSADMVVDGVWEWNCVRCGHHFFTDKDSMTCQKCDMASATFSKSHYVKRQKLTDVILPKDWGKVNGEDF